MSFGKLVPALIRYNSHTAKIIESFARNLHRVSFAVSSVFQSLDLQMSSFALSVSPAGLSAPLPGNLVSAPHVLSETLVGHKCIGAVGTLERPLARVIPLVLLQGLLRGHFLGAELALKPGLHVGQLVRLDPGNETEPAAAYLALELLVCRVHYVSVKSELVIAVKHFIACRARERCPLVFPRNMGLQGIARSEPPVTFVTVFVQARLVYAVFTLLGLLSEMYPYVVSVSFPVLERFPTG